MPEWGESCSKELKEILENSFKTFIEFSTLRNNFPALRDLINTKWTTVQMECGDKTSTEPGNKCRGLDGRSTSSRITICETKRKKRIPAVLLHELVHACGGSELDAEAVERVCYFRNGAEPPNGDDFKLFCGSDTAQFGGDRNARVSDYVIWDSATGEVWLKSTENDETTKGVKLFQDEEWKYDECKKA